MKAHRMYRIKGTTDDITTCYQCGREDLKSTVAMAALDAEGNEFDIAYFGSDCAARVAGWTQAKVKRDAAAADRAAKQAAEEARIRAWEEKDAREAAEFAVWATNTYGVQVGQRGSHVCHNDVYDALTAAVKRRTPISFLREFLDGRAS
jgi:hypothetical protein